MSALALLGRVLMCAIFIRSGVAKLMAPTATIAMFGHLHLPVPGAAYAVAILVEVGGGMLTLLGWRTRPVAIVLAVWCVATALVAHFHPGDNGQMIHFMKNLCMAGGFLQLAVYGAGRFSLDRR